MWRGVATAGAVALLLSGCGGGVENAAAEVADQVRVVVVGDSLIDTEGVCTGCTGFVQQFTDHVGKALGKPAESATVKAGGVPDAVQAVSTPGAAADSVAAADVVVVQVGYNNALPDPETGIGCKTWILDTEPGCLAEGVATYGTLYDQVFAEVKALRGDKPTVYVAMGTVNGNLVPAEDFPDGLLSPTYTKPEERDEVKAWAVAAYDRWNAMLEERATAAGFQYVDLYHAFNGPDGESVYYPELSDDGTHPNQQGHDLIAEGLAAVDLSALSGR
jgi:lysophospholipase L1-like esterase